MYILASSNSHENQNHFFGFIWTENKTDPNNIALPRYEIVDGQLGTSDYGKVVRHPFSGVAIAARFGLPPEVQHIIGTHSKEGDLGKRTVESIIVHHADFVSFEPFKA